MGPKQFVLMPEIEPAAFNVIEMLVIVLDRGNTTIRFS